MLGYDVQLEPLSHRRMDFEEFCAAAISPYQLEALEGWEQIATAAFDHFEHEGNRVISIEELAQVISTIIRLFYACINHSPIIITKLLFSGNESRPSSVPNGPWLDQTIR